MVQIMNYEEHVKYTKTAYLTNIYSLTDGKILHPSMQPSFMRNDKNVVFDILIRDFKTHDYDSPEVIDMLMFAFEVSKESIIAHKQYIYMDYKECKRLIESLDLAIIVLNRDEIRVEGVTDITLIDVPKDVDIYYVESGYLIKIGVKIPISEKIEKATGFTNAKWKTCSVYIITEVK